jgi:hypothetical protein
MLGFYVSAVFGRWGTMLENIGWIDREALLVAACVRGRSDEARMIRRNILRYMVLCQVGHSRDFFNLFRKLYV